MEPWSPGRIGQPFNTNLKQSPKQERMTKLACTVQLRNSIMGKGDIIDRERKKESGYCNVVAVIVVVVYAKKA